MAGVIGNPYRLGANGEYLLEVVEISRDLPQRLERHDEGEGIGQGPQGGDRTCGYWCRLPRLPEIRQMLGFQGCDQCPGDLGGNVVCIRGEGVFCFGEKLGSRLGPASDLVEKPQPEDDRPYRLTVATLECLPPRPPDVVEVVFDQIEGLHFVAEQHQSLDLARVLGEKGAVGNDSLAPPRLVKLELFVGVLAE